MSKDRSHLVLETRTDKNGVSTSRWVKPSKTTGGSSIPAVTKVAKREAQKKLVAEVSTALAEQFRTNSPTNGEWVEVALNKDMKRFSVETLTRIMSSGMTDHHREYLTNQILNEWSETKVNDFCSAFDVLPDLTHGASIEMKMYMKSLSHYEEMAVMVDGHYPEERATQVTAVVQIVQHMLQQGADVWDEVWDAEDGMDDIVLIKDQDLRDLVLNSEYNREDIVNIITTRNIFDAEHITEILNAPTRSLADGAL